MKWDVSAAFAIELLLSLQPTCTAYPVDFCFPNGFNVFKADSRDVPGDRFVLATPNYRLIGNPAAGVLSHLRVGSGGDIEKIGRELLSWPGISIEATGPSGRAALSSVSRELRSRVRVQRHGPLYYELVIRGIPLKNESSAELLTADLTLHCFAEKMHVVADVTASQDISLRDVAVHMRLAPGIIRRLRSNISTNVGSYNVRPSETS
ncbi:MAG: hypothetical protein HYX78_12735 [Armatimonadetes bacterium]|nr:hypothetical protein [Armatimonadota bacterium]